MRILYLGPPEGEIVVRETAPDATVAVAVSVEQVESSIADCEIILDAYMKVPFPRDLLARARKLRVFTTATTGADHVDAGFLAEKDIPLLTLRGQTDVLRNLTPAAELSWLLFMACARNLRGAVSEVLDGGWDRNKFPGWMLRGRTLGVIGCGRIGQWMSRYAQAFGMTVVGYDPHMADWPATIQKHELDEVLRTADAISIHVPLLPETTKLIGKREIALMKPGSILVNTSRGAIVDEDALLEALESGHIGAAGVDVLEGEPDTDKHPLVAYARKHPNLIITPHIGGYSPDALSVVVAFACKRALQHVGAA